MSINETSPNLLLEIKKLRIRNPNKIIIANLNKNSLPNKFEQLKDFVIQHTDILVLTKTKLNDTFSTAQFLVNGFSESYRLDRNRNGGGVMICICENILSKWLEKHVVPYDIGLFVELNVRKCKWLLFGTYHPPSQADIYYFCNLDKAFDTYSSYKTRLLIGDFNTETIQPRINSFIYGHELQNLVKKKTCFKSVHIPSYIDLKCVHTGISTGVDISEVPGCHLFQQMSSQ